MSEKVKCMKCGFENPTNQKFCGNCGIKIGAIETPKFETLAFLHVTGSAYLLISVISNFLVRASLLFTIPYIVSGLLGLYAGYEFYKNKADKYLKIISASSIAIGLAFTMLLFMIGIGVVGPSWVIFLITAITLWNARKR